MQHLAVVGGGISGLAAARAALDRAASQNVELRVTLFERDPEVGGKARTTLSEGWRMEAGPAAYLDNEPALDRLVGCAGLADRKRVADPAAANRFILRGGSLRLVSPHPLRFARSRLLGVSGLLRLAAEPLVSRRTDPSDESVWEFARRRLGAQAAERLIAPMVLGVFAGDARRLSLAAAFPRIAALEREHGSLIRGMIRLKRAGRGGGPAGPAGELTSFDDGLQALPRQLAQNPDLDVRRSTPVAELRPFGRSWRVCPEGGSGLEADAVVLAGEGWAMVPLLEPFAPQLASQLSAIDYPAVTVVALGYGEEALQRVPRGFGVLIPRSEGYRMLGCLWDSHLFAGRAPDGGLLLRAMIGGAVDRGAGELDEEEALRLVEGEISRLFGLESPPRFRRAVRWPRAIPQYGLGHGARVRAVDEQLAHHPGLFLAGNYLHGIAFGKAAARGVEVGEAVADWLARREAARSEAGENSPVAAQLGSRAVL